MSFFQHGSPSDPRYPAEPRLLTRPHEPADTARAPSRRRLAERLMALRGQQMRSHHDGVRPRRRRRLAIVLGSVATLLLIALLVYVLTLRHSMRAALPQIDGSIRVAGLSAPVTVSRDAQGVPSIQAASLDDLLFAQGFVTAGDRLWQMDALRRHASGELAEILGPRLVAHDRLQRYLQVGAAADRAVKALPPDQLYQLEAYSRGVNAYIAAAGDRLPLEFHLLHYKPAPWSPRDSLLVSLVLYQDLSTGFSVKLNRESLSAHLPRELLADLYPVGSWRDRPPTQPATDLTAPQGAVEQIPLDRSQVLNHPQPLPFATPGDLLRNGRLLHPESCDDCQSGSNNWAVAASRSASGAPLLSNDMHLNLSAPDIWYEAGLHAGSGPDAAVDVTGITLPGVPFVIVGRNAHVAWGFTNLGADVQDVRIEHLRGSGANTEFEQPDGSWSLAGHHHEVIVVRGGRNVSLDVLTTAHNIGSAATNSPVMDTPIISPLYPSEHRALSLSWVAYDPDTVRSPFLAVNTATDGASLVAAFAGFGGPSLNLIYADDARHIGYHALGRIPIRGPAIRRPHAVEPLILPDRPNDSDEDESTGAEPQAGLKGNAAPWENAAPREHAAFLLSAYHPVRRRRPASRLNAKPAPPAPAAAAGAITPPPPVIDYTIGSPISSVPTDALDASQDWSGYIPYSDLPSVLDPPSGVLATANARITPDIYPYHIASDWVEPYRAERIYALLEDRTGLTPAAMLQVQNDIHSEFDLLLAQKLAYAVDHASAAGLGHDTRRLRQAADLLRFWNGAMSADAAAPTIVSTVRDELWPLLLTEQIQIHDGPAVDTLAANALATLYGWNERDYALEQVLQHTPARWLPRRYGNWNDFLTAALARTLKDVHAPSDLAHWRYGKKDTIEIAHPFLGSHSLISRLLGVATGSGAQPGSGDMLTVKAMASHFGPSERFTADLADTSLTFANITTGESGNPASPWYLDQFAPWLAGTTFAMPLNPTGARDTLTLLPD